MNENENPIIHISGNLSEKDYITAIRYRSIRNFAVYCCCLLLFWILFTAGYSLYRLYPYMRDGNVHVSEWLDVVWGVFREPSTLCILIGFFVLYAFILIVIKPMQAKRRFHELYNGELPISYDLYEDYLAVTSVSATADQTFRLRYSDVQRKIKETKYVITLSTGRKNKLGLYKALMSPDEADAVLSLLRSRCPQRRLHN